MPSLEDVYNAVNTLAPFELAMDWDNAGLLIGGKDDPVTRALVALDVTDTVLDEAVRTKAQLLVTHHPVIFHPIKRIETGSLPYRLIQSGIGVISAHTNLDIAEGGVNDRLAQALGLGCVEGLEETGESPFYKVSVNIPGTYADKVYHEMADAGAGMLGDYSRCGFLVRGEGRFQPGAGAHPHTGSPGHLEFVDEVRLDMLVAPDKLSQVVAAMKAAHPYEEPAYDVLENRAVRRRAWLGRIGVLEQPMCPEAFAAYVKERLRVGGVKYVSGGAPVRRVAVCGGNGAGLLRLAKDRGCQALVTGESKHDILLAAAGMGMTMIDAGHYATEAVVLRHFRDRLAELLPQVEFTVAETDGDGVNYV